MNVEEAIKKFAREMVTWSRVTRVGPTADQMEPFENYVERAIKEIIVEAEEVKAKEEREACRRAVRSVADELHPERDHMKWGQWTSAIEEAEKRIRARSS